MLAPGAYVIEPITVGALSYDGVVVDSSGLAYLGIVSFTRDQNHGNIQQIAPSDSPDGLILAPLDWRTRYPRSLHWEE